MTRSVVMTCVLLGAVAVWLVWLLQPDSEQPVGTRVSGPGGVAARGGTTLPSPALPLSTDVDASPGALPVPEANGHAAAGRSTGARGLALRVIDEQRRPIAGAVAAVPTVAALVAARGNSFVQRRPTTAPTDVDGRTLLHIPANFGAIEMIAARFRPRTVYLSPEDIERAQSGDADADESPLTVMLASCASLAVDVFAPGGAGGGSADGLTLFLSLGPGDGGLFGGERAGNDPLRLSLGASRWTAGSWSDASGGVLGFPLLGPDEDETGATAGTATDARSVLLACVQPGVPLRLHVEDDYGSIVRPQEIVVLAAGEARDVQWVLDAAPATRVVEVVDPWGVPVERAMVSLEGRGPNNRRRLLTDLAGQVRFESSYGLDVRGKVSRDGFVPRTFEELAHDPAQGPLRLVLSPGRELTVDVVCRTAADLAVRTVSANLDGVRVRARQEGVSSTFIGGIIDPSQPFAPLAGLEAAADAKTSTRFVFKDVPVEAFPIRITALGRSLERVVPADVETCVVELPATGSLDVTWAGALPDSMVVLELRFDSDTPEEAPLWIEGLEPRARDAGLVVVPCVFPGSYRVRLIVRGPSGHEQPGPWRTVVAQPARAASVVLALP